MYHFLISKFSFNKGNCCKVDITITNYRKCSTEVQNFIRSICHWNNPVDFFEMVNKIVCIQHFRTSPHVCMQILSTQNETDLPAAIRAAFAKFPVSIQAINSLLSSTVFLRTKAGFPFPHFGRLRIVLETKKKRDIYRGESTLETEHPVLTMAWTKVLGPPARGTIEGWKKRRITWCFLADCYMRRWRTQRHSVFVAPQVYWPYWSLLAPSPLPPPENHLTGLRGVEKTIGGKNIYNRSQKYILRILVAKADAILDQSCSMNVQSFKF